MNYHNKKNVILLDFQGITEQISVVFLSCISKMLRRSAWAAYIVTLCSCLHSVSKTESGNSPSGGFTQKSRHFYLYFGPLQSSSFFFCEVDDDVSEHETSLDLSNPGTSAVLSVSEGAVVLFVSWHV